jgi:ATP-dependent exoDNAse (exonuclease V) beta subunit
VHIYLERIASEGLKQWPAQRPETERAAATHRLGRMGVADDRLEPAVEKVVQALSRILSSERGRWLLTSHELAACEFSLSGIVDGRMVHAEIDRTFVDEQGVRWIVDYKTGDDKGAETEAFVQEQARIYRGQLDLYARLLRAMEPARVVRTALYFPMLDGWITL